MRKISSKMIDRARDEMHGAERLIASPRAIDEEKYG
jgi:hypothetical protein